jgi:hypothetical protein
MLDDAPPWFRKALGAYLRQSKHWQDKHRYLLEILEWLGLTPPPGKDPNEWAETVAKALAQKWQPMGRPRKDSRRWEQLTLPWVNLGER